MTETPASPPNLVTWALVPNPNWGKTAYTAIATCPHGETSHILIGSLEIAVSQAQSLAYPHTVRAGCHCGAGPILLDGVPIGQEGGGTG